MWRIWAPLPRGTWTPPGPGTEPMSPALAGRLPTSRPPGKSASAFLSKAPFPHLGNAAIAVAKFLVAEHCGWLPSGFRSLPSLALLAHGVFLIWSPCQTPLALPDPKVQPSASLVAHLCSRPTGPFLAVQLIASRAEAPRGAVPQLQVHTCEAPVAFSTRGSSDQTHAKQIYLTRTLSFSSFLSSLLLSLPPLPFPSLLPFSLSFQSLLSENGDPILPLNSVPNLGTTFKPFFFKPLCLHSPQPTISKCGHLCAPSGTSQSLPLSTAAA